MARVPSARSAASLLARKTRPQPYDGMAALLVAGDEAISSTGLPHRFLQAADQVRRQERRIAGHRQEMAGMRVLFFRFQVAVGRRQNTGQGAGKAGDGVRYDGQAQMSEPAAASPLALMAMARAPVARRSAITCRGQHRSAVQQQQALVPAAHPAGTAACQDDAGWPCCRFIWRSPGRDGIGAPAKLEMKTADRMDDAGKALGFQRLFHHGADRGDGGSRQRRPSAAARACVAGPPQTAGQSVPRK